jgi:hypothetical protein
VTLLLVDFAPPSSVMKLRRLTRSPRRRARGYSAVCRAGATSRSEPNLLFVDPQAKVRASIGLRGELPSVWLADAQGKLRAQLGIDSRQEPILKLHGPDGRVQWDATAGAAKDVPAQK